MLAIPVSSSRVYLSRAKERLRKNVKERDTKPWMSSLDNDLKQPHQGGFVI